MTNNSDVTKMAERIACVILALFSFGTESTDKHEFCLTEHFNASCAADDVILMTSAFYGRMHLGRCIRGDYNLGCSNDVIGHFDALCSGRKSCDVAVRSLVDMKPCQRDFASFLEATYKCITVSDHRLAYCPPDGRMVITASSGFLSNSLHGSPSTFGRQTCPWVIQSRRGQRVQLSLIFLDPSPPAAGSSVCQRVIVVDSDVGQTEQLNVCANRVRERVLYKSLGHHVTVYTTEVASNEGRKFLLSFKVVGCPLLNVSGGVWVKSIGDLSDDLMIRCNDTLETWYVTCQGNRWVGEFGNCSSSGGGSSGAGDLHSINGVQKRGVGSTSFGVLTQGLLLALGLGLILGVLIAFTALIGICCFKHWCRQNEPAKVLTSYGEEVSIVDRRFPALLTEIEAVAHLGLENVYLRGGGGSNGGGGCSRRGHCHGPDGFAQGHKVSHSSALCDLHLTRMRSSNGHRMRVFESATVGIETDAMATSVTKSDSDKIISPHLFSEGEVLLGGTAGDRYPPGLRTPEHRPSIV